MQALPFIATAASTAFGVISKNQAAKAQEAQMEQQAKLAETRAVERDLARRKELERASGAIKAARASSGSSIQSPLTQAFLGEANQEIGIARLREFAGEMQTATNLRASAAASRRQRRLRLIGGGIKSAVSLAQAGANLGGGPSAQQLSGPF